MNTVILLLVLVISKLLVLTPPVAVWRALTRKPSRRAAWLLPALALIGPFIAALISLVLVRLPAYSGQCGGDVSTPLFTTPGNGERSRLIHLVCDQSP